MKITLIAYPVRSKSAFTLIELLVVIAIIAILAAILFPVFATAREKARQSSCASNEKQLGLGLVQYLQDYDETPPYWNHAVSTNYGGWAGQIYSYVKSTAVFTCPDDQNNTAVFPNVVVSYAANDYALNNSSQPHSTSQFTAPAVTVAIFEVTGCTANVTSQSEMASWSGDGGSGGSAGKADSGLRTPALASGLGYSTGILGNPPRGMGGKIDSLFPTGRHSTGSNFIFWDGHVKWIKSNLVSPGETAGALGCNQDSNANSSPASCAGPDGVTWGNAASTDMAGGANLFAATFSYR
ncbi:MAG: DUF1559 domain-containing protein [Capsulimonadaceae bacterium]|nr:DUF1559 domain-containing protein [Capsulimonadaceae bacterium]